MTELAEEVKAPPKSYGPLPRKRVRTPSVLQMEAVECGAAALCMILQHHGKRVPLETVREACGVSRNGTKASAILKAAAGFGLNAKGLKREPEQLGSMRLPFIVFWNFNHYVVVEGFGKNKVFLNDPSGGPRTVTAEEFDQSFTGVALSFEKSPDFQPGGEKRTLFRLIRPRLARNGVVFLYLALAMAALVIPGLVIPVMYKVYIDQVLVGGMHDWLRPLLLAMLLACFVKALLTTLQLTASLRQETRLSVRFTSEFFWHVLRLPMDFFSQRWPAEIGGRLELNQSVASLLSGELALNAVNTVMVVAYAGLLMVYDPMLACIVIGLSFLNFPILRWAARRRKLNSRGLQQEQGKLVAVATTGLQMIETLKATGAETSFFARWAGHHAKVVNAEQKLGSTTQLVDAVPPLLLAINLALVLGVGGMRVIDGVLTVGMLIAFQSLTTAFTTPVNQLVSLGARLAETESQLIRLDDVLRNPEDPEVKRDIKDAPAIHTQKLTGELELRNLTFGYSKLDPPLLRELSVKVRPGQRVALVGASGSGKSTVAKLVTGLYQPWSGEILFDGKRRDELPRDLLCNSIAMVDQDIFLFRGQIRENLTLWDATLPERALLRSAKDAQIHDDISERPSGYAFQVDEGGRNFSGGQRQRMEIARALVGDPRILILDEATSALDARVEHMFDDALRRRGCTTIVIAHRLSTIRDCDEIIVLERGVAVERGTHDEMLRNDGPYAKLIRAH